jgi:hypothetical protein
LARSKKMTDDKLQMVKSLVSAIPELTDGQLYWIHRVVGIFSAEHNFSPAKYDLLDDVTLQNLGDAIRVHHCFSAEPFTKDKFEYVLVRVLNMSGHKASLAPKGNPGHDATVDEVRLSLKTQADKSVNSDVIWISKFMELGKGRWSHDLSDLRGLRDQFLRHMKNYDRILMLRALTKGPRWSYELVEIPKKVLEMAPKGTLEMMTDSKQLPKPGYCRVRKPNGDTIFDLYFDGGTERKLQIKNLAKEHCLVHATWDFVIPPE